MLRPFSRSSWQPTDQQRDRRSCRSAQFILRSVCATKVKIGETARHKSVKSLLLRQRIVPGRRCSSAFPLLTPGRLLLPARTTRLGSENRSSHGHTGGAALRHPEEQCGTLESTPVHTVGDWGFRALSGASFQRIRRKPVTGCVPSARRTVPARSFAWSACGRPTIQGARDATGPIDIAPPPPLEGTVDDHPTASRNGGSPDARRCSDSVQTDVARQFASRQAADMQWDDQACDISACHMITCVEHKIGVGHLHIP